MELAWDDTRHKVLSRLKAKERKMTGHKSTEDIAGRGGRDDSVGGRTRQRKPLQQRRRIIGDIGEGRWITETSSKDEGVSTVLKHQKE